MKKNRKICARCGACAEHDNDRICGRCRNCNALGILTQERDGPGLPWVDSKAKPVTPLIPEGDSRNPIFVEWYRHYNRDCYKIDLPWLCYNRRTVVLCTLDKGIDHAREIARQVIAEHLEHAILAPVIARPEAPTIRQWLEKLEDPVIRADALAALANPSASPDPDSRNAQSMRAALRAAFIWAKTPQRYMYWARIAAGLPD